MYVVTVRNLFNADAYSNPIKPRLIPQTNPVTESNANSKTLNNMIGEC